MGLATSKILQGVANLIIAFIHRYVYSFVDFVFLGEFGSTKVQDLTVRGAEHNMHSYANTAAVPDNS